VPPVLVSTLSSSPEQPPKVSMTPAAIAAWQKQRRFIGLLPEKPGRFCSLAAALFPGSWLGGDGMMKSS